MDNTQGTNMVYGLSIQGWYGTPTGISGKDWATPHTLLPFTMIHSCMCNPVHALSNV